VICERGSLLKHDLLVHTTTLDVDDVVGHDTDVDRSRRSQYCGQKDQQDEWRQHGALVTRESDVRLL
jgi:hypothetical protein